MKFEYDLGFIGSGNIAFALVQGIVVYFREIQNKRCQISSSYIIYIILVDYIAYIV